MLRPCLALVAVSLCSPLPAQNLPSNFVEELVLDGLSSPMGVAFLPSGDALVWEKTGEILSFDPAQPAPQTALVLDIPHVQSGGERGLIDLTISPSFETDGLLYVFYVSSATGRTTVSTFAMTGTSADPGSENILWESNDVYGSCCHYGGGIDFLNDGTLVFTTGDQFDGQTASALWSTRGKVLRINADGSIPADNPFLSTSGALPEIYCYGLRNPFRARVDDETDRFIIAEVGGNNHSSAHEDIHVARAGANFGWPFCEGDCGSSSYDAPLYSYAHTGWGASITGGFVYRGTAFPQQYQGAYFYADFVRDWLRYLTFDENGNVVSSDTLLADWGPVVMLEQGPDGALYGVHLDTSGLNIHGGQLRRIRYISENQPPSIQVATASVTSGTVPLTVDFDANANDPDGDPLSYHWTFGDGGEAFEASPQHEYAQAGSFEARLEVSDGTTSVLSDPITIAVGAPPQVTISAPIEGALFRYPEQIAFTADGADPDGDLGDGNYSWSITFVRPDSSHPVLGPVAGSAGLFEIPLQGQGFSGNVFYELSVTVTDNDGLTATDSVRIYPDKVDITFATEPPGIPIIVDGNTAQQAPFVLDTLIGFPHNISSVASTCMSGAAYAFDAWSDGGALSHEFVVPEAPMTLTANFMPTGACARIQSALAFDGIDDYVALAPVTLTSDFTLEFWVYLDGVGQNTDGVVRSVGQSLEQDINFNNGRIRMHVNGATWDVLRSNFVHPALTWHHYAFTRSGDAMKLYVDGVLDVTDQWSGSFQFNALGRARAGFLAGRLDEMRLWDRSRSANEIARDFRQAVRPTSAGLSAYWPFSTEGQEVLDESGNGRNGTLGADATAEASDPERRASGAQLDANRALSFDGTNDVAALARMELTGDFTLEAWVRLDSPLGRTDAWLSERGRVRSVGPNDAASQSARQWIGFEAGALRIVAPGLDFTAPTALSAQTWTHVALTRSDATIQVYQDGKRDTAFEYAGPIAFDRLGRTASAALAGALDELRIWNCARTPDELRANARRYIAADQPELLAYYRFDELSGEQTLSEHTGNFTPARLGQSTQPDGADPARSADAPAFDENQALALAQGASVQTTPITLDGDFTLEGWVKVDGDAGDGDAWLSDQTGSSGVVVSFASGRMGVDTPAGRTLEVGGAHATNAWRHYALVREGDALSIYMNGQFESSTAWTQPFTFDTLGAAAGGYLTGRLDEFRIWNVARTSAELSLAICERVDPGSAGLVLQWTFDDPAGSLTVLDRTLGAQHATIVPTNSAIAKHVEGDQCP